jgi:hypothetical protein
MSGEWRQKNWGTFPHCGRAGDRAVSLPWFPKNRREPVEGIFP